MTLNNHVIWRGTSSNLDEVDDFFFFLREVKMWLKFLVRTPSRLFGNLIAR